MQPQFLQIANLVLSLLSSSLAAALVSVVVYGKREKRRFKVDTLKRFAANRYDLRGDDFTRALNEIYVVFNKSAEVMHALQRFHDIIRVQPTNAEIVDDQLVKLFKAMCDDTRISYKPFNDSFFLTPFNTRVEIPK